MSKIISPHKTRAPGLPRAVIDRPRLDEEFGRLLDGNQFVAVFGAPGSGKTVQAQLFAAGWGLPLAWLTLDRRDGSPPRFLMALARTLDPFVEGAQGLVENALQLGYEAEEVGAFLVEAVGDQEVLLVVDDCETVAGSPQIVSILGTCIRHAPGGLQMLLLSREELGQPVAGLVLEGMVTKVTDDHLRLTVEEATALLAVRGSDVPVEQAMRATGGWVAGVAFWPAHSTTGERPNDLSAYLSAEILDELPPFEQQFLIETSILHRVTPKVAATVCNYDISQVWRSLMLRHLPATTTADGALAYHAVFRTFLRGQLELREPDRIPELSRRYADVLTENGQHEEATDLYLAIGDLATAARSAELSLAGLYGRADWQVLTRWLDALGPEIVWARPLLLGALIRSLHGSRRFDEVRQLIREADRLGNLRLATHEDRALLATVAWAMQERPAEAHRLLSTYDGDFRADAVRFMIAATSDIDPVAPPHGSGWGDVERLVTWGLLAQGRLVEVIQTIGRPGDGPVANPNLILARICRGEIREARSLWERIPLEIQDRAQTHFVRAWLLLAEDDVQGALAATESAVTESRQTGFALGPAYLVFCAQVLLKLDQVDDAAVMLEEVMQTLEDQGNRYMLEWAQALTGLAYLLRDDTLRAELVLQQAVRSMQRARRHLFLPLAAVYLSEAEARLGNDEDAQRLAALAYDVTEQTGASYWLVSALHDVPAVLNRERMRDLTGDRWARLIVSPSAQPSGAGPHGESAVFMEIQPFGPQRDLILDGRPLQVGRLKVIELAAYLSLHPDGVDRSGLQQHLFPNVDQRRGGNHFRQIVHKFHEATGIRLERNAQGRIVWPDGVRVDAMDARFERLVAETSASTGEGRRASLEAALALAVGDYLASSDLEWAEQRRYRIELIREEALLELVRLCLDAEDYRRARELLEMQLASNPYSEEAHRDLLEVERSIGTESSAAAVSRRATRVFQELGMSPQDVLRILSAPRAPTTRTGRSR